LKVRERFGERLGSGDPVPVHRLFLHLWPRAGLADLLAPLAASAKATIAMAAKSPRVRATGEFDAG
ncbi:MAG TPA: hypothetical protein PK450_09590, partial [Paracoccaceae bacterium]|nr:hypothetical protein [Paracoccaceae bacterium]